MALTTKAASELTDLSESWLRELARREWVKAEKDGREWRFDEPVLKAYLSGQWISIAEASTKTGRSVRKLVSLAKKKLIQAEEVSGFWLVNWQSLLDYLHQDTD